MNDETADWKHRAEIAEAALKTIELEETAAERMTALKALNYPWYRMVDGVYTFFVEETRMKVRGMSDQEFRDFVIAFLSAVNR